MILHSRQQKAPPGNSQQGLLLWLGGPIVNALNCKAEYTRVVPICKTLPELEGSMSQSPFIPFYTSDFLGGTGGMTAATKGACDAN